MYYPSSENKGVISFAVTAKLICVFVFAYANCWFSHAAAQMLYLFVCVVGVAVYLFVCVVGVAVNIFSIMCSYRCFDITQVLSLIGGVRFRTSNLMFYPGNIHCRAYRKGVRLLTMALWYQWKLGENYV